MGIFDYYRHLEKCDKKQAERKQIITTFIKSHPDSPTQSEIKNILTRPLDELIRDVQHGKIDPVEVLNAFGKAAIKAHERTNCLTEIMIEQAKKEIEARKAAPDRSVYKDSDAPLAGLPVSVKDTVVLAGYDATIGVTSRAGVVHQVDGPMIKLLKDAGAIPFVKTNVPTTLLSFESSNDVWGRTVNPNNPAYSPGGSTGGEAALLALNGSRVGIGSDVAGSVRLPAAWSGCAALRCSTGRWPRAGTVSSMPGQEGVPSVFSPMARSVTDLHVFIRGVMQMRPWEYDYSVHPIPWDESKVDAASAKPKLRIGVMRSDGVVDPTAPCLRALNETISRLEAENHEVFEVKLPAHASPAMGLVLAGALLNSDGCSTFAKSLQTGESNDPGAAVMLSWARLPRIMKWVYCLWVKYVRRDALWAEALHEFRPRSSEELWQLVSRREKFRADWHAWWDEQADRTDTDRPPVRMDVLLTVPNATPALPHGAMKHAFAACGYTFLWNLLDYSSGVLPVSRVDPAIDNEPTSELATQNAISQGAYRYFNADTMKDLPLGVQVVARRWEEETVIGVMKRIQGLVQFQGLEAWNAR